MRRAQLRRALFVVRLVFEALTHLLITVLASFYFVAHFIWQLNMQPPSTPTVQAVMAFSLFILCVNAPGVIQRTELYTSHKDLSIPLNRECDNIILMQEEPKARVNGQSIPVVHQPFHLVGDKMMVSQDVDFLHRILCEEPNHSETEYRIQYKHEPSKKNAATPSLGSWASVFLFLTLAAVITMCG